MSVNIGICTHCGRSRTRRAESRVSLHIVSPTYVVRCHVAHLCMHPSSRQHTLDTAPGQDEYQPCLLPTLALAPTCTTYAHLCLSTSPWHPHVGRPEADSEKILRQSYDIWNKILRHSYDHWHLWCTVDLCVCIRTRSVPHSMWTEQRRERSTEKIEKNWRECSSGWACEFAADALDFAWDSQWPDPDHQGRHIAKPPLQTYTTELSVTCTDVLSAAPVTVPIYT